ncbi:MAG: heme ABC transporter ATP-binding protein [Gammaproteobacteria bacterium]|nr:MAG: heme ABC transporter ATP-binding protein [Gammaproteobacteria bacterium]
MSICYTVEACRVDGRKGKPRVDDVSFEVRHGEFVALIGPNGAGKSTLLALLSGERAPDRGKVLMHGQDLRDWSPRDLARCRAILPQSSQLSFDFRAEDVVAMGRIPWRSGFPGESHDTTKQHVERTMALADVSHLAGHGYASLSGGEQQRVQLARVLAQLDDDNRQAILLLDEPTSALDLSHQHAILSIVHERVHSRQLTAICVLHDLNLAATHADRVMLLENGRIVGDGTPADVLTRARLESVYGLPVDILPHPCDNALPLVVTGRRHREEPPDTNRNAG